jgi:hypothetical protein
LCVFEDFLFLGDLLCLHWFEDLRSRSREVDEESVLEEVSDCFLFLCFLDFFFDIYGIYW